MIRFSVLLLIVLGLSKECYTQVQSSPYSINGIGDLNPLAFANSFGMGNTAIATPSYWHLNVKNPALLVNNTFTIFQMAYEGELKYFDDANTTERSNSLGVRYLAMGFPIIPQKLTSSIGIVPYSTVNYNFISNDIVNPEDSVTSEVTLEGSGGLNMAYLDNGYKISKNLSLGFRFGYVFGNISKGNDVDVQEQNNANNFVSSLNEETSYSGVIVGFGLHYKQPLKEETYLNFGLTYDPAFNLTGSNSTTIERLDNTGRPLAIDTLNSDTDVSFKLPSRIGLGISYQILNKLTLGTDFTLETWEDEQSVEQQTNQFATTMKASLGVDWIPDYDNVSSYFKRVSYRLGVSYEKSPYLVDGEQLDDIGINFGVSLPVRNLSSLDFGFKLGQRGTTNNGLIKERYFKFVIGGSVNSRWFVRRKYD